MSYLRENCEIETKNSKRPSLIMPRALCCRSDIRQINRANFATYGGGHRVQLRRMALFLTEVLL